MFWWLAPATRAIRELAKWQERQQDAKTERARIEADLQIKRLEGIIAANQQAVEVRKATADHREVRLMVFVAGFPPSLHFAAVCVDSLNWFEMPVVHALPAPMDEWQGAIILSFFGLVGLGRIFGGRK